MERLLSSTRLLAVLLLLLLLADSALAWRVPVSAPSPPAAQARHPRGSSPGPLQAAVYSTPSGLPPSDGSSVPLGPVATPSGYKFVPYDGEEISKLAVRQWWRVLARLSEVALPITNWYALVRSDEMMGLAKLEERQAIHARKLREVLVSLGPTFIKIGQALSNRPDLVGPVYKRELELLQDTVAPFPDKIAFQIIEAELGRPANEVFEFLQEKGKGPVASASLGQVYKARVRETGQLVAVKVQRPNILRLAEIDLAILRAGAGWLQKARKLRSDLQGIVGEFGEKLYEEIDYVHEAANLRKFRKLYAAPRLEGIVAPDVVDSLTTKRVLTMEWVEGTKQPQWGADTERLISLGLECSTYQLLETGFLHSDPHPGNLLRTAGGDLCYLDHGMCTQISEEQRYGLVRAVSYLYAKDFDRLAGTFVDLGFVSNAEENAAALEGLGPALRAAFTNATGQGAVDGRGESLLNLNFASLSSNIADVAYRFPIRIPPYWSLVIRCLTILEGIALTYNPRFRVVAAVYPLVVRFLLRSSGNPILRIALQELLLVPVHDPPEVFGDFARPGRTRYRIRWSRLEKMLEAASRPVSELLNPPGGGGGGGGRDEEEGSVAAPSSDSLFGGDTLDLMLNYVLSENGAYLRDALIEDVLGALDDANLVVLRGLSLLTGGLLPPPAAYPDQDRLAVIGQLLRNLRKLAVDRGAAAGAALESPSAALVGGRPTGEGRSLSPVQAQALASLARQVLAAYAERRAQSAVRRVFHGVERALHSQQRPYRRGGGGGGGKGGGRTQQPPGPSTFELGKGKRGERKQ